jgi:subtilase family serine protease
VTVDCATAKPDVSIVASDPSATEAGRTTGTFTVARTGSTSASLTVLYTVGGTATPGLDYTALSGSVVIPAGASAAPIVVTPILDKLVEVESVVVTLATDAAYNITPPGAATVTISDGPDMMVSALTAPASGGSGGTITVGATTKNAGNGPADASVTRVYFSLNDSKLDVADQLITTIAIPALAPAGTYPSTFSFTIPASTPSGTHYLIAVSDALKTLPETKETNNQKNKKILVGPDLYISALTTSTTTVAAGGTMTLTETTKDTVGASPVTIATTTRVYLSFDNSVGAGDVVLSARTVPTLASGGHSVYTHTLQIPAGISGTRYLIVLADADNALWETKETNNKKTKTITITP